MNKIEELHKTFNDYAYYKNLVSPNIEEIVDKLNEIVDIVNKLLDEQDVKN